MTQLEAIFLAGGAAALCQIAIVATFVHWRRGRNKELARRTRRVVAPLAVALASDLPAGKDSIFRTTSSRSELSRLFERRYPFLELRRALPRALGAGLIAAVVGWLALWFLKVPAGGWTLSLTSLAGAGGIWYALGWMQARQETEFVRVFPEVVDQVVRLAGAGVPSLEALSVVTEDAPEPVASVLRGVCDGLVAGLDADVVLRSAAERVRLAEFTMFAAVLRLQRRSGGGVSTAFANLAKTLRERRRTALKAHASTAQSRITLLILAVMPVLVLISQRFIAPGSVEVLFGTDDGTTLLRVGVGLIVAGILVARAIVAHSIR